MGGNQTIKLIEPLYQEDKIITKINVLIISCSANHIIQANIIQVLFSYASLKKNLDLFV